MPGTGTVARLFAVCAVATLSATFMAAQPALACTDARIVAEDGSVLTARSMEFGVPLDSRLVIRPRGTRIESPAPTGGKGMSWSAQYGYAYLDGFNLDAVTDGLNEAGLGFGALYLPGETTYETVAPADHAKALSNLQFGAWVLSQFATADEVRAALPGVKVFGEPFAALGNTVVPLHFVIHDAKGRSIVLEWVDGKLNVHENTVGVVTNSPAYDWHMTNLRNFVNLTPVDPKPVRIGGITYAATGQGGGLAGLPGDPTPPARFVQTAAGLHLAVKPKSATDALVLGQKLMNRVDIPRGLSRDFSSGVRYDDITQWVVFRDHANRVYYYRTYTDMTLRALDLKKVDMSPGAPARRMPIATEKPTVLSVDPRAMPLLAQ